MNPSAPKQPSPPGPKTPGSAQPNRAVSAQDSSVQQRATGDKAVQGKSIRGPVRDNRVIDKWNQTLGSLDPSARKVGYSEVTTTGDGAQIPGFSAPAGKDDAKNPVKRESRQERAVAAIKAYVQVDRTRIPVNSLFSDREKDVALIAKLKANGSYIENDGTNKPPQNAIYVVGKTLKGSRGKEVRQFLSSGVVLDRRTLPSNQGEPVREQWTTMSINDLNARTNADLAKIRFFDRGYSEKDRRFAEGDKDARVMGWFDPDKLLRIGQSEGGASADLRDAYDQTNTVTRKFLDEKQAQEEGRRFAKVGHHWMGADWHGAENWRFRWVPRLNVTGDPLDRKYYSSVETIREKIDWRAHWEDRVVAIWDPLDRKYYSSTVREKIVDPIPPGGKEAQELAYKIFGQNPDKLRYREDGSLRSHFTTCLATATTILDDYGVDPFIFNGLMAPVFQAPKQAVKPRDTAIFRYLKESGAWVWGHEGFTPSQGDIFLTGTFTDVVNSKDQTHGLWSFQHVGVVADTVPNADGTYTLLTQDGGKGMASLGEDKTGYTIRNYSPATRLLSGASPKMLIGVWRPGALKAALQHLPAEIKATLTPRQLESYERKFHGEPKGNESRGTTKRRSR